MLIKARSHTSGFNNRPDIWQQPVPDFEIRCLARGEETIYGCNRPAAQSTSLNSDPQPLIRRVSAPASFMPFHRPVAMLS